MGIGFFRFLFSQIAANQSFLNNINSIFRDLMALRPTKSNTMKYTRFLSFLAFILLLAACSEQAARSNINAKKDKNLVYFIVLDLVGLSAIKSLNILLKLFKMIDWLQFERTRT